MYFIKTLSVGEGEQTDARIKWMPPKCILSHWMVLVFKQNLSVQDMFQHRSEWEVVGPSCPPLPPNIRSFSICFLPIYHWGILLSTYFESQDRLLYCIFYVLNYIDLTSAPLLLHCTLNIFLPHCSVSFNIPYILPNKVFIVSTVTGY